MSRLPKKSVEKSPTPPTLRFPSPLLRPFRNFVRLESASGILLLLCALAALAWANSPWGAAYQHFKELSLGIPGLPLGLFVNDALMAIFFLLMGLEIKREILTGELSSPKKSALPILAALGGMLAPAILFVAFNKGLPGAHGWGIPIATDIAFALGVMTLLGKRVPPGLKVFLVALAILDDLGAILVIAVFYTEQIHLGSLAVAGSVLASLVLLNLAGKNYSLVYMIGGFFLWINLLQSGVHPTIAGVLLALCIPHRENKPLAVFEKKNAPRHPKNSGQAPAPAASMLQRFESNLHPYVSFGILPLFALVNAGVVFSPALFHTLREPLGLGILAGLCLGKPLGILLFSRLAVTFRIAALPAGTSWTQLAGAGILGGIGFTMSLFIAALGLPAPALLEGAKLAVLTASLLAGLAGYAVLRFFGRPSAASVPPASR
jgi:NhaA family Na+:H+ antiporter